MTLCCSSLRQSTATITLLRALPARQYTPRSIAEPIKSAHLLMPYADSGASAQLRLTAITAAWQLSKASDAL